MSKKISIPAFNKNVKLKNTDILDKLMAEKNLRTIKIFDNCEIVELNDENSKSIENAINDDPNYIDFGKIAYENAINKFKTINNIDTRGWLTILRGIDITNSTNVWRYDQSGKQSMDNIVDFICDEKGYKEILKRDKSLIKKIIDIGKQKNGDKDYRSFVSKVCKYIDEYANTNKNNYDNFYFVDDYYIRRMLPYYYYAYTGEDHIEIDGNDTDIFSSSTNITVKMNYEDLYNSLDKIYTNITNKNSNIKLTRSKMDHIIWYSYKSFEL